MARTLLLIGAAVWAVGGIGGLTLALLGIGALTDLLPPLTIDRHAVGRAVTALAVAALGLSLAHVAVAAGLGRGASWAWSAGTLLAGLLGAASLVGVAAAITTVVAGTMELVASLGAATGTLLMTAGYGLVAARLVGEMSSRGRA